MLLELFLLTESLVQERQQILNQSFFIRRTFLFSQFHQELNRFLVPSSLGLEKSDNQLVLEFRRLLRNLSVESIRFIIEGVSKAESSIIFQRRDFIVTQKDEINVFLICFTYFVHYLILMCKSSLPISFRFFNPTQSLLSSCSVVLMPQNKVFVERVAL